MDLGLPFMLELTPNTLTAMVLVLALLVLASIIQRLLVSRLPAGTHIELQQRIRSWWIMVLVVFTALVIGHTASLIFFTILSFIALREFFSILPVRLTDRRLILALYLLVPVHYYWIATDWYGMFTIFIPVYLFLLIPFGLLLLGETKGFIRAVASYQWAVMTTVFAISHVAYLLMLPAETNPAGGGVGLVLYLVFLTQFNDVAQYIWGKTFGRRKIVPGISPNKTWEGFLGGIATTTLLGGLLAPWLTPLHWPLGLLAGLLIGIAGFVGDLTISAVKRDLLIKDTGQLIPGHGGILDRIDSLMYTAPLFFHFLRYTAY
ncbi:phosphatidate cytidylyltransferase [Halopseudomonas bauzanensis]|uniref:Phosphatidate cytidylyltransferase n=1 Tax=Halopseudomonas bauzanensis TaxID=653930 RepID=A0A1H9NTF8_9GAMM|nr:phosphatidate cytidylyltransferase [Halopseudomonas bauzanensis]SER39324.1 phosphatidate cytidylyltransferase [Halopseudomonas bauzanensis]SFL78475.1 phosphatidate cytidylyltransferase [Halopseudomonas bauzanensis]